MTDAPPPDEDLRRWFRALDFEHPAVRVLWKIALQQKEKQQKKTEAPPHAP